MAHRLISLIVVARDEDPAVLETTVHGLLATTARHAREIIVVDDGSQRPVALRYPHVSVLRNRQPLGVSPSRRRGASAAAGSVLTFLDAHMSFAPGWIEAMLAHVDSGALLCTPWRDYAHAVVHGYGAELIWRHERSWDKGHHPGLSYRPLEAAPAGELVEVPMVIGACYMMLRETYWLIGGSCPLLRGHGYNDVDLSIRAWLAGPGVACVPGARVGHRDGWSPEGKPRYRGSWAEVEHNLVISIRSNFEPATVRLYQELLAPLPAEVTQLLDRTDVAPWRERVQRRRVIGDAELFRRLARDAPLSFRRGRASLRPRHDPVARLAAATLEEEAKAAQALAPLAALRSNASTRRSARRRARRRQLRHDPEQLPRRREAKPVEEPAPPRYTAGIVFRLFGARVGIRATHAEQLTEAWGTLPACATAVDDADAEVDLLYSLVWSGHGHGAPLDRRAPTASWAERAARHELYRGAKRLLRARELEAVWQTVGRSLERKVPLLTSEYLFVHAGVVAFGDRAVLLVGDPPGRRALQAALLLAGGRLLSDTFAVLDARGRLGAWPSSMTLRGPDGGLAQIAPDDAARRRRLRPALVVSVRLEPRAAWRPRPLSPGAAALALFSNAVVTRDGRERAFQKLSGLPGELRGVQGSRGPGAMAVAADLLERLGD